MTTEMTILLQMLEKGQVYLVLTKQMIIMMMMSSNSVRGNWKQKLALDGRRSDNEENNDSNIDAIEKIDLSSTIKTDDEDDNGQNSNSMFIQFHVFNNLLIIIIAWKDDPRQMIGQPGKATPNR